MAWLGLGLPSYRSNLSENLFGESVAEPSLSENLSTIFRGGQRPRNCTVVINFQNGARRTRTPEHTVVTVTNRRLPRHTNIQ